MRLEKDLLHGISNKKGQPACIVDVHSHILPWVDDGAKSMEETLEMLSIASEEGITHMIATPHYKAGRRSPDADKVRQIFLEVQEAGRGQGISVSLFQGNEVLYFDGLGQAVEQGRLCPLCYGEYLLVEFSPPDDYRYIRNGLYETGAAGYVPVLAHVERYACLRKKPDYVEELKAMGAEIQINADSVTGRNGPGTRKFVHRLLKEGLVDYIGTDAHGSRGRSPCMRECCKVLYKKYDSSYVNSILYGNALERILRG